MSALLQGLGQLLWGPGSILFVLGTGVWFTVGTGFLQLVRAPAIARQTVGSLFCPRKKPSRGSVTPVQAVAAALAGTMGTGNIAGIATALVAGGPGAIFWMWVSAFFGAMTKYAEVALAVKYRRQSPDGGWYGGPAAYIEDGLGKKWLSLWFSASCVAASFGIGNATQVHSAAAALWGTFGIPPVVTGLCAALLCGVVLLGGVRRVGRVAEALIPLVSLLYLAGGSVVLWANRGAVPHALGLIVTCAFTPRAALGGVGGYSLATALRVGVARGIFSNEAGLGSAPMAHAAATTKSPNSQGYWGIFEVFADTLILCTFTGVVLLSSGSLWQSGLDGAALTSAAFTAVLGRAGGYIVALSLALYALATLFCWGCYGMQCAGKRGRGVYCGVFLAVAALSPLLQLGLVWDVADILNAMMAIPNLFAILSLSKEVFALAKRP
ncbi:MAG: amino acid carrier protein [Angelakisella sp.]